MSREIDQRLEGAVIGVGFLMLQRMPKAILVTEEVLMDQFEPALNEFKDLDALYLKGDFEPPQGFKVLVRDYLMRYLESRGHLK